MTLKIPIQLRTWVLHPFTQSHLAQSHWINLSRILITSTLTRAWCTLVTGIRMKVHRNPRKVSDNYSTLLVILPSPPSMYHRLHGTALTRNLDITSSMVTFQSGWVKMMDGYAFMLGQTIQGQRTIQSTTFIIILLSQLLKKRLWIQLTHHSFTTNHMN